MRRGKHKRSNPWTRDRIARTQYKRSYCEGLNTGGPIVMAQYERSCCEGSMQEILWRGLNTGDRIVRTQYRKSYCEGLNAGDLIVMAQYRRSYCEGSIQEILLQAQYGRSYCDGSIQDLRTAGRTVGRSEHPWSMRYKYMS